VLPFTGFFKDALDILGARYFGKSTPYESEEYLKVKRHTKMELISLGELPTHHE
jgi:hypothetical protein